MLSSQKNVIDILDLIDTCTFFIPLMWFWLHVWRGWLVKETIQYAFVNNVIHELGPFVIPLWAFHMVISVLTTHGWGRYFILFCNVLNMTWFVVIKRRDDQDDDDRWTRRRKKLKKLVTIPALRPQAT